MNDMAPVSDHLTSRRRAEQALHLRAKQRTWREIAETLGYRTEAGARLAVRRLLPTLRLAPEEGRRISAETLRVIQRPLIDLYDALAVPGSDIAEVTMLAREIRANNVEAAKLDDLYSPKRVEVTVGRSPAEIIESIRAELAALPAPRRQRRLDTIDAEIVTEENAV